ncbi:MAG: lysophospholipid acyltransferase family protein, partial [Myxococcota bacterium]|nr:lysophospholipid acyltransferase family protein [Myxococcota bacterium]
MIPAQKSLLFSRWFGWVAQRRIAGTFGAVRIRGLASVAALVAARPVLVVSNHTSWWDPLVVLLSSRLLGANVYAMMDAKQLRALPFFARAGAFGVDLVDPRDGARAVRYAAGLLDRPGRLVWLFPQGREVPTTARPLAFR